MPVRGEAVAVDERVVVGEVEDAGFGVSGLYGMGRWNAQGRRRRGEGRTWGFGVTLPTSTQLNPRLNRPIALNEWKEHELDA